MKMSVAFICLFISLASLAQMTGGSEFQADSQGSKDERIAKLESYVTNMSQSYSKLQQKLKSIDPKVIEDLRKKIQMLEQGSAGGGCCSVVNNSNLPKLKEDVVFNKNKVLEVENAVNTVRTTELAKIRAEIQVMNATLDSLKTMLENNAKLKQD
jgi:hypothetical protein